jgi:hypothetical protein
MKYTCLLAALFIWATACNSKYGEDKDSPLTNAKALEQVNAFIEYRNTAYDGGGRMEPNNIEVTKIWLKTDTAEVLYRWSGIMHPPPLPIQDNKPDTVDRQENTILLYFVNGQWTYKKPGNE